MRRIVCLLLTLILCLQLPVAASAQEAEEPKYGVLPVLFDGVMSEVEYLDVMYLNGVVYANVHDLAGYWGYNVHVKEGEYVNLVNKTNTNRPRGYVSFFYKDTQVARTYGTKTVYSYEAPAPAVFNDAGNWIPLEYTVLLLNGEILIQQDDTGDYYAHISPPQDCVGDVLLEVTGQGDRFMFDWFNDFAYTDEMINAMANASNVLNLINDCLSLDGSGYVALFQQGGETAGTMDAKYGDELAILMCANSQKEAQAVAQIMEDAGTALSADGLISDILEVLRDAENGNIEKNLQDYVKHLDEVLADTNTSQAAASRSVIKIKKSVNALLGYDTNGTAILAKLEEMGYVTDTLKAAAFLIQVGAYLGTYYSQDEFSVQALTEYLSNLPKNTDMPDMMKDIMLVTTASFMENPAVYTAPRAIVDSLDLLVNSGVGKLLGTPAVLASFAWDVGSGVIPGLSDVLDAADQFQLSLYASVLQSESMIEFVNQKQILLTDELDAQKITELAQYCYVYLKSCFVTRDAGVASLKGVIKDSEYEAIKAQEDKINDELAEYMVILKTADASNEGYPLGFLPADNEVYLATHDETNLAKLIMLDPYASYLKKIEELEAEWGEVNIVDGSPYVGGRDLDGLCYIKLLDFDADGLEELVVAYRKREYDYQIRMYGYDETDHNIVLHYDGPDTTAGDIGGNSVCLSSYEDRAFLLVGTIGGYDDWYEYYGFSNGVFKSIREVTRCVPENIFEIDGKQYSKHEFDQLENPWLENCERFYFACYYEYEQILDNLELVQENREKIEEKAHIRLENNTDK